jgi:hypothetical protein
LHERLGFKQVATFRQVGFKHDQWLDVAYWQLIFRSLRERCHEILHERGSIYRQRDLRVGLAADHGFVSPSAATSMFSAVSL